MEKESPAEQFFQRMDKEVTEPLVEELMKHLTPPPPNAFTTKEHYENKVRNELRDYLNMVELRRAISSGMECIMSDLRANLAPVELEAIYQEWIKGLDYLSEALEIKEEDEAKKTAEPPAPSSFCDFMKISDITINHFYTAGLHSFEKGHFEKAGDIFLTLALLDPLRHNVWIALGICKQRCNQIEMALHAYSMAALTDITDPFSFIYSAQCCIQEGRQQEANDYLDLATEALKSTKLDNSEEILNTIHKLRR